MLSYLNQLEIILGMCWDEKIKKIKLKFNFILKLEYVSFIVYSSVESYSSVERFENMKFESSSLWKGRRVLSLLSWLYQS